VTFPGSQYGQFSKDKSKTEEPDVDNPFVGEFDTKGKRTFWQQIQRAFGLSKHPDVRKHQHLWGKREVVQYVWETAPYHKLDFAFRRCTICERGVKIESFTLPFRYPRSNW